MGTKKSDSLACPHRGEPCRLITGLTESVVVHKILGHLRRLAVPLGLVSFRSHETLDLA